MPPTKFPKGVTIHEPEYAHECHVLYDGRDGATYLIDITGKEVHSWPHSGFPSEMIDPAVNDGKRGHVLVNKEPELFFNKALLELDWDGNVVWEWGEKAPGGQARQNHDLCRLANGNTLLISKREFDVPSIHSELFTDQPLYEVAPEGNIVWEWIPHEHFEELGMDDKRVQLLFSKTAVRPRAYIFVLNNLQPLGPNKWFNSGDARFHPDNIMIDSRETNFVALIEKATGKVVWRLGPDYPAAYDFTKRDFHGPCPKPIDTISGQHDAHMIPPDRPGAGNVLIFVNDGPAGMPQVPGKTFPGSRVLEIDPITEQIVWQYDATKSGLPFWGFYSSFISSARRLPNGNTLICEGMYGRIFQVTQDGRIVWEFVNPHYGEWSQHAMNVTDFGGEKVNWVFRAQPIPNDWLPVAATEQ